MPGIRQSDGRHLEILAASPAEGVPIEVDVYDGANLATMMATLDGARGVEIQPELSETGAGKFVINRYDPKATDAILASGNLVRIKVGGVYREAFWIEEPTLVEASTREQAGEDRAIRGRGTLACLERAIVYPPIWPPAASAYRSATASDNGTGATSVLAMRPAGSVAGDVLIAVIACAPSGVPAAPPGWRLIANTANDGMRVTVFRRLMAAREPASYRFTWAASTAAVAHVVAIANATADETQYAISATTGSGTAITNPSVAVGLVDSTMLTIAATKVAASKIDPPFGLTEVNDHLGTGVRVEIARDPLAPALGETGDRTSTATDSGSWVGMTLVIPSTGSTDAAFSGATFGQVLVTLLEAAQSRGAIPFISWDFDAETDSLGNPWPDTHELSYHVGTTILDVWRSLVALGLEGWMGQDLRLRAFVDASRHFEDTVIFRKGHHIEGDVEKAKHDSALRTRFLAEGAGGRVIEVTDPVAETDARIGRREGYVAMSTSDDATTLQRAGEGALAMSQLESNSLALDVSHGTRAAGLYEPWVDYRPGDWVSVDSDGDGTAEVHRIVGMWIRQTDAGDYTVNLDLNSVTLDLLDRMARDLAGIRGTGSGGSGSLGLGGGAASGAGTVAAIAADTPGYLFDKIEAGPGVTKSLSGQSGARLVRLEAAGVVHPDLATHDALGLATDAELASHVGASDPHTGYQKESEKGAASGYASLDGTTKVPIGELPTGTSGTTVAVGNHAHAGASVARQVVVGFDGGGAGIAAGAKQDVVIPAGGTLTSWTILAQETGSIEFGVWSDTYGNFPPTVADSITASAPPALIAGVAATDAVLSGWDTSLAAGDILRISVASASGITKAILVLAYTS